MVYLEVKFEILESVMWIDGFVCVHNGGCMLSKKRSHR